MIHFNWIWPFLTSLASWQTMTTGTSNHCHSMAPGVYVLGSSTPKLLLSSWKLYSRSIQIDAHTEVTDKSTRCSPCVCKAAVFWLLYAVRMTRRGLTCLIDLWDLILCTVNPRNGMQTRSLRHGLSQSAKCDKDVSLAMLQRHCSCKAFSRSWLTAVLFAHWPTDQMFHCAHGFKG